MKPTLLAGCGVIGAGILAGCSDSRMTGSPDAMAAPERNAASVAIRPASAALDDSQFGGHITAPAQNTAAVGSARMDAGQRSDGAASVDRQAGGDPIPPSANIPAALPKREDPVPVRAAKTEIGQRFANAALDDRQLGRVRGGMSTGSGMVVNFSFQEATYVNHNLTQSIIVPTMTILPGSTSGPAASGFGGAAAQVQVSTPSQVVQSVVNSGMTSVVSSLGGGGVTNHISNTANNQLVQQVITANIGITGLGQTIQQGVASTVMSRVQAANAQFR